MKTRLLTIMLLALAICAPVSVFAEEDWTKLYGPELANAPVNLRNEFSNSKGKPWHKATYDERLAFLDAKEEQLKENEQKLNAVVSPEERAKAAIKARKDAEKAAAKLALVKEKAKIAEKRARDKKLQALVKKRQDAMKRLRQSNKRKH